MCFVYFVVDKMKMKFFVCGLLLAVGCKRESAAPPVSVVTNQTYAVRGVVQAIPPDHRHATIKHEAIPGYMAAMTMDFSVRTRTRSPALRSATKSPSRLSSRKTTTGLKISSSWASSVCPARRAGMSSNRNWPWATRCRMPNSPAKTGTQSSFPIFAEARWRSRFSSRAVRCRNIARA